MWARVSRAKVAPEKLDAVVGFFQETKALEGMTDAQVLVDRAQSKVTTVTYWETEAAMKETARAADEVRAQAAADISWEVEEFEVAA